MPLRVTGTFCFLLTKSRREDLAETLLTEHTKASAPSTGRQAVICISGLVVFLRKQINHNTPNRNDKSKLNKMQVPKG